MTRTKDWIGLVFTLTAVVLTSATFVAIAHDYASAENAASANLFEPGRYLVKTSGCNDVPCNVSETDRRAIRQYVKLLAAAGQTTPE
jgi:hypothetical protein